MGSVYSTTKTLTVYNTDLLFWREFISTVSCASFHPLKFHHFKSGEKSHIERVETMNMCLSMNFTTSPTQISCLHMPLMLINGSSCVLTHYFVTKIVQVSYCVSVLSLICGNKTNITLGVALCYISLSTTPSCYIFHITLIAILYLVCIYKVNNKKIEPKKE